MFVCLFFVGGSVNEIGNKVYCFLIFVRYFNVFIGFVVIMRVYDFWKEEGKFF